MYYAVGAQVTYEGQLYQCLQAHTSESTWEPNVTPALWKDLGPCSTSSTAVVFPNPATTSNQVELKVPTTQAADVTVKVYTVGFRMVSQKEFPNTAVGSDLTLELTDNAGNKLANGLYYVVANAQGHQWVIKMLVMH